MELSANAKAQLRLRFRHDRALSQSAESFDSWKHILEADEIKGADHIASYISYGQITHWNGSSGAVMNHN